MPITLHGTNGIDSPDFNATGSVVPANGMYLPSANTLAWTTNSTRNMTLDASGRLGVGATSPQFLVSTSQNNNAGAPSVQVTPQFYAKGYAGAAQQYAGIGFAMYEHTNGYWGSGILARDDTGSYGAALAFYTSTGSATPTPSERARINSSGNLLVGMTVQANNAKLSVFSDNTTPGGIAVASNNSLFRQIYLTNTGTVLQFWNGSNQANLSAAGAWTNASDARLKKDIVDIKYGLNTVLQSKPRSFNRIDVAGEFIGFIAQELKKIMPEVVFGSDAEGDQYTVDYASMVAVAFKAIQELTQRLEALEAK